MNNCINCGKISKSKFCNSSCSATYNNKLRLRIPAISCLACGKQTTHKCFCSSLCYRNNRKDRKKIYIDNWLKGNISGTTKGGVIVSCIREYLVAQTENKCQECGWCKTNPITNRVPIEIEHIDGDYRNNSPSNLKVLCPNCHSLTPTYRALNKGKGREKRKSI